MTKTWDILVTRDVTESCSMVIEAENLAAAHLAAWDRARADLDLVWEPDDTPNDPDPYITNCEEVT